MSDASIDAHIKDGVQLVDNIVKQNVASTVASDDASQDKKSKNPFTPVHLADVSDLVESDPRKGARQKKFQFHVVVTAQRVLEGTKKAYQTGRKKIAVGSWYINDAIHPHAPRRGSKKGGDVPVAPAKYASVTIGSEALAERLAGASRDEKFALLLGKNFASANLLYASPNIEENFARLKTFLLENLP